MISREIVSLLMSNKRLINTIGFEYEKYVGDPINTIRIFSQFQVDELILYDIDNNHINKKDISYIQTLTKFAEMPFTYGGGIRNAEDAEQLIHAGCDKISINSLFFENLNEVNKIINKIGKQSVSVSINYKRVDNKLSVCSNKKNILEMTLGHALSLAAEINVGEVVLNNVDYDGSLHYKSPYEIEEISCHYPFSLVLLGGNDFRSKGKVFKNTNAVSYASGTSHFFHGKHRAVLIQN